MRPDQIRSKLIDWLAENVRVDARGLNLPESIRDFERPPSIGLDLKASEFELDTLEQDLNPGEFVVSASIPLQVIYRFDNSYRYTDIPRGLAESILVASILKLIKHPHCIDPDVVSLIARGSVTVREETKGDWLLIISFEIDCNFYTRPQEYSGFNKGVFAPIEV